jgi:hypothetical protein
MHGSRLCLLLRQQPKKANAIFATGEFSLLAAIRKESS